MGLRDRNALDAVNWFRVRPRPLAAPLASWDETPAAGATAATNNAVDLYNRLTSGITTNLTSHINDDRIITDDGIP